MYLPETIQNEKDRDYMTALKGYNHNLRIDDAEFYDMKNITADNYPVLSSRDKRKCVLNIASKEFEDAELTIKKSFVEESLSLKYAIYTLDFPALPENEYRVQYDVNADYVGQTAMVKSYFSKDGDLLAQEGNESIFLVPEGCEKVHIEIKAYKRSGARGWSAENLEKFVTGFQVQRHNETIRGMVLKQGKLAYMIGSTLYWDDKTFDFSGYTSGDSEMQLISYGAYILAFPEGLYVNTQNISDYGYLGAEYQCGGEQETITYSVCDMTGADYTYTLSDTAPEEPEDGQYWMRRTEDGDALYRWADTMAMWVAVSTTYIKIKVSCTGATLFPHMFKQYDSVFVEGSEIPELNGVNIIYGIGEEDGEGYILVTGVLEQTVTQETGNKPVTFKRKIPRMDHVCVSNNRVWGCFYGVTEEKESLNEIYACKLGDPTNWYSYMGTAQDSYALSLGDDGEFTGAYTYQGYPLFFKENNIYKIYGTYPAAYQLVTYDCRGLQKGSGKSLAIVDEYLVYKSISDICVFDGNYPMSLSAKLGKQIFTEAAAGAYMGRYYISMKDEKGKAAIYIYDFSTNMWTKDEEMLIEEFISTKSGELYGRTKVQIVGFGNSNNNLGLMAMEEENRVDWYLESGEYGYNTPDRKRVSRIAVRASIAFDADA